MNQSKASRSVAQRDPRFELLRIVAMLCILLCHVVANNGWGLEQRSGKVGVLALTVDQYAGQFGVALFFMLSGYFLTRRTTMGWSHIGKVAVQTFVYSVLCLLAAVFMFNVAVAPKDIYRSILPILNDTYWFVTAYIIMLLFAPFYNVLFNNLNRQMQFGLILIMIALGVVPYITFMGFAYNGLQWTTAMYAVCCYCIGGYIQRHGEEICRKFNVVTELVLCMVGFCLLAAFMWAAANQVALARFFEWQPRSLFGSIPIFAIAGAAGLLLLTTRCPYSGKYGISSRAICFWAPLTFGIYLIHQQPVLLSPLWNMVGDVFPYPGSATSGIMVMFIEVIVLFISLGLISWVIEAVCVIPLHRLLLRCNGSWRRTS